MEATILAALLQWQRIATPALEYNTYQLVVKELWRRK